MGFSGEASSLVFSLLFSHLLTLAYMCDVWIFTLICPFILAVFRSPLQCLQARHKAGDKFSFPLSRLHRPGQKRGRYLMHSVSLSVQRALGTQRKKDSTSQNSLSWKRFLGSLKAQPCYCHLTAVQCLAPGRGSLDAN